MENITVSKLPIPEKVLDQHVVLLGKTRSGKSSTMRVLVEHLLDQHKPVCIVDPKGDWWGLKLAANGKGPGYPIVIFGGQHADVPINARAGAHVAELIATGNRPSLVDLKGWTVSDRTQFWIDFASTFFKLSKGMRWLAVDEAHHFAPKGRILSPQAGMALHWSTTLADAGLGMGIHLIVASQRPQKVHNDVLTSCETLIAKRVIHPRDREAIEEWILDGAGDAARGKEVLSGLAQLDRSEGWVWSPEIDFGPKQITFPLFSTYDSFKPQDPKRATKLKGWASVDLAEVKAKLAAVIKEAEASDPKALRAEIARLKAELAKAGNSANTPAAVDPDTIKKAEERGFEQAKRKLGTAAERELKLRIGTMTAALRKAGEAFAAELKEIVTSAVGAADLKTDLTFVPEPAAPPAQSARALGGPTDQHRRFGLNGPPKPPKPPRAAPAADGDGALSGPTLRLLTSIAFWQSIGTPQPSRSQVAFVARYSPKSSGFEKALSIARTAGLIDYPSGGRVALRPEGQAGAQHMSGEDAADAIMSVLSRPQLTLAGALITAGAPLTREELAQRTNYSDKSSGFEKVLSQLNMLEIARYPERGKVEITEWAGTLLAAHAERIAA
jgi:hypothetical protein